MRFEEAAHRVVLGVHLWRQAREDSDVHGFEGLGLAISKVLELLCDDPEADPMGRAKLLLLSMVPHDPAHPQAPRVRIWPCSPAAAHFQLTLKAALGPPRRRCRPDGQMRLG